MFENIPRHCIHINWQQNLQSNNWVCESQLVYKNMANIQLGQIFYVVDTVDCKHISDLVSSTIKFSASGNGRQTCLQHMTFELNGYYVLLLLLQIGFVFMTSKSLLVTCQLWLKKTLHQEVHNKCGKVKYLKNI